MVFSATGASAIISFGAKGVYILYISYKLALKSARGVSAMGEWHRSNATLQPLPDGRSGCHFRCPLGSEGVSKE